MTRRVPTGTFRRSCACGWAGTYQTKGRADHAKRRHSCARHRDKADRAQRHEGRLADIDRTPKPCLHPVANHTHGTRACYTLDGCRCRPCAAAVREYETNRVRQHAYQRWNNLTDATPARVHAFLLMDAGMGWKRIAAAAGLSQSTVWKLLYGKQQPDGSRTPSGRVRPDTAAAVLAVTLDRADGAVLPEREMNGIRIRLRALIALGWTRAELARRLGTTPSTLGQIVAGLRPVLVGRAARIRALYDELSMTVPTPQTAAQRAAVARAKSEAAAKRWPPPLDLSEDYLDDPDYDPAVHKAEDLDQHTPDAEQLDDPDDAADGDYDEAAVLRRLAGDRTAQVTKADRIEIVRRALAQDWTYKDLETIAGIHQPDRYRTDRPAPDGVDTAA